MEDFEKTEEYRLAFRRFACTFLRFPVTTVPPVASMISMAPLAADPCWQVITPMMFGPNISGKASIPVNHSYAGHYMVAGSNGWDTAAEIDVDCLLEKSAIYGGSTTVQPASIRLLPVIKI